MPACRTPLFLPLWWRPSSGSFSSTVTEPSPRRRTSRAIVRPMIPPPITRKSERAPGAIASLPLRTPEQAHRVGPAVLHGERLLARHDLRDLVVPRERGERLAREVGAAEVGQVPGRDDLGEAAAAQRREDLVGEGAPRRRPLAEAEAGHVGALPRRDVGERLERHPDLAT